MDPVTLVLGAVVSVIVQFVKGTFGVSGLKTAASLVVISFVAGFGLFYVKQYGLLDATMQVLVYAGATYGLLLKNIQGTTLG